MRLPPSAAIALLSIALCNCMVGPDYRGPPPTPAPTTWHAIQGRPLFDSSNPQALARWWTSFRDPELDRLVGRALAENLDIRAAQLRIEQARAERQSIAAPALPALSAAAQAQRYRVPAGLRTMLQQTSPDPGGNPGSLHLPGYLSVYQLGFDASWELDLFGGTRRAVQAADAATQVAIAQRRGAVVSTLAELGSRYMELRGTQRRIAIANELAATDRDLLALTRSRAGSGLASELDVARAQSQLHTTLAALPPLEDAEYHAIHVIAVLLGEPPEPLEAELASPAPPVMLPLQVPVALPATVLAERPDVQAAERQLAEATASIGVAEAARLPSLTLTGSTGLASGQLDQLLRHDSWVWNDAASLTAPLFQGGRLQAQQRRAEDRAAEVRLQYRLTLFRAMQESEDALRAYATQLDRDHELSLAEQAADLALQMTRSRYRSGINSYLEVLDADRTLARARDDLAVSHLECLRRLVALYKALGGGWQIAEPGPATVGTPESAH